MMDEARDFIRMFLPAVVYGGIGAGIAMFISFIIY